MNENNKNNQQQSSEFSRDKDRAIAAGLGAVVGGAAFAAATYSVSTEEEAANSDEETVENNVQNTSTAGIISHPEAVSVVEIEASNPIPTAHPNEISLPISSGDEEVSIINIESGTHFEESAYPDEGAMLHSDTQEIMDISIAATSPSLDGSDCIQHDTEIMPDDNLYLI